MDGGFKIEKCTFEDIEQIRGFSRHVFKNAFQDFNSEENMEAYISHAFSLKQMEKEFRNPYSFFYKLTKRKVLIGYLKLNVHLGQTERDDLNAMEIERVYIHPDYQGKGLGTRLVEFARQIANTQKKSYLWLGVWEKNVRAIKLYEEIGFEKFGSHPFNLGTDEQTDILMRVRVH